MLNYFRRFDNTPFFKMCFVIVWLLQDEILHVFCYISNFLAVISSKIKKSALN